MWTEFLLGGGGVFGIFYGSYIIGKMSVRYDVKKTKQELTETIKLLENSKEDHNDLIDECKETLEDLNHHFLNY